MNSLSKDFLDSIYGCSESNKSNIFAPAGAKINSGICLFLTFSYLELGKYLPMGLCEGLPKVVVCAAAPDKYRDTAGT